MDELSLYVLDITMNSVRAGATHIVIELTEQGEWLTFRVSDNGCGIAEERIDGVQPAELPRHRGHFHTSSDAGRFGLHPRA